ncbi:ribonuclease HII [Homoserinibacter sp. GY 40078]|uniref:ribonuclease HII n=1 Tax=Homoserinibacter sp. GY 40078 TaxID=2603275 RepID=UPI0011CA42E5|nr:ribonuclease HII [Homoserinibacter sp. GY 40078]TXK17033.1 ribonuclease HII [Homoserinibacter sp. GY 40078]
MAVADPTLRFERALFREGAALVIGCDEVGRGAIAGPVAVGLGVFLPDVRRMPEGLRDSKLLSEARREALHPLVASWAPFSAVGMADNAEVDRIGIVPGLGLAAMRGLETLVLAGVPVEAAVVVLDGSHDWLTPALADWPETSRPRVVTRVKADRDCATVAAASVLAKVQRDRLMVEADAVHPGYEWTSNKGYASASHYSAIERLGSSPLHRWSWLKQPALF